MSFIMEDPEEEAIKEINRLLGTHPLIVSQVLGLCSIHLEAHKEASRKDNDSDMETWFTYALHQVNAKRRDKGITEVILENGLRIIDKRGHLGEDGGCIAMKKIMERMKWRKK